MGYARRRVGKDGSVEEKGGTVEERREVQDAGQGWMDGAGPEVLSTATTTPSESWGVEEGESWAGLVVRERTNEGESGASPAPDLSLDDLSDLAALAEDDAIDELGDRIIKFSAHMSAAEYRLLVMIAEFDRREGWKPAGHKDCAAWLEMNTGLSRITARERVRVARALRELPETSKAMSQGELSFSKVRGLVRVATPKNEMELLPLAKECTARQLERELQRWEELERWSEEKAERRRHRRADALHLILERAMAAGFGLQEEGSDSAESLNCAPGGAEKAEALEGEQSIPQAPEIAALATATQPPGNRAGSHGCEPESEHRDSAESMESTEASEGAESVEGEESVEGAESIEDGADISAAAESIGAPDGSGSASNNGEGNDSDLMKPSLPGMAGREVASWTGGCLP